MTTVTLDPEHQELVNRLIAAGRYPDAESAVADALRLLEEQVVEPAEIPEWHKEAVREGIADAEAGRILPLPSIDEIIAEADAARQ